MTSPPRRTPPVLVDSHLHLYRSRVEGRQAKADYDVWEYDNGREVSFATWDGVLADAHAAMEATGVTSAVITNMLGPVPAEADRASELVAYNEWLCQLASERREFFPCYGVEPGCSPLEDQIAHLRAWIARSGRGGVKLHPSAHGFNVASEAVWPVFELCQAQGLPVVCHSGPSKNGAALGEPESFRPVLEAFPRLRIVLAHLGGAAWRQTARLAADYPSVSFDCCEIIHWLGATHAPSTDQFVELVRVIGAERIMMGSDFPWYDIADTVSLIRGLPGLTGEEKDALLGVTARGFFGLE